LPDFFDLIIVHECHRGSARYESAWRAILEYFDLNRFNRLTQSV
jgi:type I restriction enzyme R subunit